MATFSRTEEAGNTLVLKAGDRRSAASKRIRTIEKSISDDLGLERLTEALRVLCRTAAELTFVGEELRDQLVTGKPISVELMGRNADRLQRTMKELREQGAAARLREHNARVLKELDDEEASSASRQRVELEDDDDEEAARPPRASRPRGRRIRSVIIDPKERAF